MAGLVIENHNVQKPWLNRPTYHLRNLTNETQQLHCLTLTTCHLLGKWCTPVVPVHMEDQMRAHIMEKMIMQIPTPRAIHVVHLFHLMNIETNITKLVR